MKDTLLLFVTVVIVEFLVTGGPAKSVYTFYDNVLTLLTLELPAKCQIDPLIIPMWKNATMICSQEVESDTIISFMQPIMYFPYMRIYICDLKNTTNFYIIANCGFH